MVQSVPSALRACKLPPSENGARALPECRLTYWQQPHALAGALGTGHRWRQQWILSAQVQGLLESWAVMLPHFGAWCAGTALGEDGTLTPHHSALLRERYFRPRHSWTGEPALIPLPCSLELPEPPCPGERPPTNTHTSHNALLTPSAPGETRAQPTATSAHLHLLLHMLQLHQPGGLHKGLLLWLRFQLRVEES